MKNKHIFPKSLQTEQSYVLSIRRQKPDISHLSDNWKDLIDVLTPEHLAFLIDLENDAKSVTLTTVWPLEILALKASIKTYSLKRKPWSRERLVSALSIKGENLSIIFKWFRDH